MLFVGTKLTASVCPSRGPALDALDTYLLVHYIRSHFQEVIDTRTEDDSSLTDGFVSAEEEWETEESTRASPEHSTSSETNTVLDVRKFIKIGESHQIVHALQSAMVELELWEGPADGVYNEAMRQVRIND